MTSKHYNCCCQEFEYLVYGPFGAGHMSYDNEKNEWFFEQTYNDDPVLYVKWCPFCGKKL